jgi:hypothetical protein
MFIEKSKLIYFKQNNVINTNTGKVIQQLNIQLMPPQQPRFLKMKKNLKLKIFK